MTRTTSRWTLRTVCVALLAMTACACALGAQSTQPADGASAASKEFVDETGRAVRVPQPVRRIVSLAPSLTETVFALGLQDKLVGDTNYCDYPAEAQKKTKVGDALNPSLEQVVALKPDVVLMTKSLNRIETVRALERLGIAVYGTDPHTVEEILTSTRRLADVLGASDVGDDLAKNLEQRLAELQQKLAAVSPKRVLFIVWSEPLISVGKDTFIADALRRAGAVSIVDSAQGWPQISLEEVVHQQPEFLVFAASHSENSAHDFDAIAQRRGWDLLDAVKNRRFAVISEAVNRPAPRIVSAIEELARQLHPEAFATKPEEDAPKMEKPAAPPTARPRMSSENILREPSDENPREYACVR